MEGASRERPDLALLLMYTAATWQRKLTCSIAILLSINLLAQIKIHKTASNYNNNNTVLNLSVIRLSREEESTAPEEGRK